MKAFVAAFYCETNTFSPLPCGWQSFREQMLYRPGEHPDMLHEVTAPLWALRQRARKSGWTVVEGTCAYAKPSAPIQRSVYESIRDEILEQLKAAMPLDMVVLSLHGAMMADGYLDSEGDIAARVRAIVGDKVAIGMLLDPHCHLSQAKLDNCDIVILLKESPHTDFAARSEELLDLLAARVAGRIKPRNSVFDCRMIDLFVTTMQPMRSYVDELLNLEGHDGVLSISVAHGMELGDSPDMGAKVLVVTNDAPEYGDKLAEELGQKLFALRGRCMPHFLSEDEALAIATSAKSGPLVLADSSDNPGAGAAGDSTFLLSGLMARGERDICIGPIWDPIAVRLAFEAGVGARLPMRIAGKMGPESGNPIDAQVEVLAVDENACQTWAGTRLSVGRAAAIRFDGVEAVINDTRTQAFGFDLFTNLGVNPAAHKIIILKSTMSFLTSFKPYVGDVFFVRARGSGDHDMKRRSYKYLRRPIWPLDDDPFG
jgi:microcystin degradation protein MlrC